MTNTLVFEVSEEEDGGFITECLTEDIFTQGDNWEELKSNIQEAVKAFYFEESSFPIIQLHLVKNEILLIQ
ncbi:type II toxin-antitoxin system HicB family antitoxin [Cronbergia sp. UHCC 0137]|uniref:type II toxin-antitoxin system HicB family antitoxin n=1 Tax=Cronbergia sp. UHCC 0137 TaxID=3110239 RepID=UPI002B1FDC37|nr:type II toxin-antitoxin system HicB family antitoxin [Cronbergia sp. UHCC 0137]MEA5619745.1 type II toxin-antitoxin system HicB family antitoxin [Cronbergia sp. UHCC 0137]